MKFLVTYVLFAVVVLFGCDQESGITSPISNSTKLSSIQSIPEDIIREQQYSYPLEDEIYPPGADSIFILSNFFPSGIPNIEVSKVIDGKSGGRIETANEFIIDNDTITIQATLNIPSNAFNSIEEITMLINNDNLTISFFPHLIFNGFVEFDIKYTGIEVTGVYPHSIDFIFQDFNGSIEQVSYRKIRVDNNQNSIHLEMAELLHFSRYGFVNRQF